MSSSWGQLGNVGMSTDGYKVLRTYIRKEQNMRTNATWGSIRVSLLSTVYKLDLYIHFVVMQEAYNLLQYFMFSALWFTVVGERTSSFGIEDKYLQNAPEDVRRIEQGVPDKCNLRLAVAVIMIVRREHYLPNEPLKIYFMGLAVLFFSADKFTFISE